MLRSTLYIFRFQLNAVLGAVPGLTTISTGRRQLGGCSGGDMNASPPPAKKKSVLDLFRSLGAKKTDTIVQERTKQDAHARTLLGIEEDVEYQGHAHGDHARALESDLKARQQQQAQASSGHGHSHDGHGHSHDGHGHSHDGHGHSHDGHGHSHDGHGHSHAEEDPKKAQMWAEDPDDFVEMWNKGAPNGPEHGGPRGLEPTRYTNEWEKKGRVSDFT